MLLALGTALAFDFSFVGAVCHQDLKAVLPKGAYL